MRTKGSAAQVGTAVTDPRIVAVCQELLDGLDAFTLEVVQLIRQEEPYYVEVITMRQLVDSVRPNVVGLLQSVMTNETSTLAAPRRTGRTRAEQQVPLAIVLHAYRLGALHIWNSLVKRCGDDPRVSRALLDSASALWTALDVYSQELAVAYRDVETEHLIRDARLRETALVALFSGITSTGQGFTDVAEALRLPQVGTFVVVSCDPPPLEDDGDKPSPERTLTSFGVRSVWRSETDCDLGLVALTRSYRVDRMIEQMASLGLGRVGVSEVFESVLETPAAAKQARMAREAATPGTSAVTRFEDARVAALVAAAPELATGLAQQVLGPVLGLDVVEQGLLLGTLRAWYAADGSAAQAGRILHCHPNTVRYRLGKVTQLIELDLRSPTDVAHLYLALEACRLLSVDTTGS
ncbi:helix-turn-helix domain-containing protein [Nocardioides psychrotolerans]|uniref:PucR family transcriptional regulator n=1 Tax=Nocardioides psychrotolerans TaxID=1005945 RepID=UPI0031377CEC